MIAASFGQAGPQEDGTSGAAPRLGAEVVKARVSLGIKSFGF
jgi:hypothetical protein